jgi:hypothetical protein
VIETGAASRWAIAQMDNAVFWLGDDGVVYRANGYQPVRVSTHAIEQAIARCNTAQAFAFTYEDRGHQIFYLTFPDGLTWGYDAASGEWHRRQSYGLDRWRINALVRWNGQWIAGDYSNGKLYRLEWSVQNEDGQTLERRRVTGVLSDNQNAIVVNGVALVFDSGMPGIRVTGASPAPAPTVQFLTSRPYPVLAIESMNGAFAFDHGYMTRIPMPIDSMSPGLAFKSGSLPVVASYGSTSAIDSMSPGLAFKSGSLPVVASYGSTSAIDSMSPGLAFKSGALPVAGNIYITVHPEALSPGLAFKSGTLS